MSDARNLKPRLGVAKNTAGWAALFSAVLMLMGINDSKAGTIQEREIEFISDSVRLSGTLVFPAGRADAAVVIVHGGGKLERMLPIARRFADENIAVFTYDKRGVGKSQGSFDDLGVNAARGIETLASDALAAADVFAKQRETDGINIGFMGFSQAAWVAPIAAKRSSLIKYMALWSGPVCTLSEELHFSAVAEHDPTYLPTHTSEQIRAYMKTVPYRPDDVDPRPVLTQLSIPGLFIFGGKDHSIPVQLSIERLQQMRRAGHTQYQYKLFPEVAHNLTDADSEGFEFLVSWLKRAAAQRE